jgi:hypothetical protein
VAVVAAALAVVAALPAVDEADEETAPRELDTASPPVPVEGASPDDVEPTQESKPQAPAPDVKPAAKVELVLSASPIGATLYLDGEPLSSNPAVARPEVDGAEHRVMARAPGHYDKELTLRFDKDRVVAMELRPIATAGKDSRWARERRRKVASRRRAAAAATARQGEARTPQPDAPAARADEPVGFGARLTRETEHREIYDEVPF